MWGNKKPHASVEHIRDSPKVNVFCSLSRTKVYGPFFFAESTITGIVYLNILQWWLMPQLSEDFPQQDFWFQQDVGLPHWHLEVCDYLDENLPGRWIGQGGLIIWPPRSPDLTPLDYYQ
jgi:hypothetical protein